MSEEPTSTARLAELVACTRPETVPDPLLDLLATCVLDWAGAAAGGAAEAESSPPVRSALAGSAGAGEAVVVGEEDPYPAPDAAFLNGTFAHSLELDDTYLPGRMHPGAPVIAAALAVADPAVRGRRWLAGIAAGYELSTRLSAALGVGAFRRGFHPTGVAGAFGAAAAVGNLRGLDERSTVSLLGIVGSMASGSTQYLHDGAWNKRLHAGLAARTGVFAPDLAAAGVVGAGRALEGALAGFTDDPDPAALTDGLGERWEALRLGIKPYPCCRLAHSAIDVALRVRDRLGGPPDGPVTVRLNPDDAEIVAGDAPGKREPSNTVAGQFSVYFQTAVTLLHGAPGWSDYARLGDPDVVALARRITAVPDPAVPPAGAVLTFPGTEVRVDVPSGEPAGSLDPGVVEDKARSLAAAVYDGERCDRIVAATRALAQDGPVRDLTDALRGGHR